MTKRILVVDDDDDLRDSLVEQLEMHEEFSALGVESARKALDIIGARRFDLMILDVGLQDMDGREACKLMRKRGFKSPIVMLTGQASDADTILGLDAGANDYMAKPFRFPVLLARLRAQFRQHEQSEDAVFSIGRYSFTPSKRLLVAPDGSKVRLTDKETGILRFLQKSGKQAVPRNTLLREVWGYNPNVTTHTLETHIYRLRQKIEREAAVPELLVTEDGGYRLVQNAFTNTEVTRVH